MVHLQRYFYILMVVFTLAFSGSVSVSEAQSSPIAATGFPTDTSSIGSDTETVNVNNLNLHVNIPYWSIAGRSLNQSAKFTYDTQFWTLHQDSCQTNIYNIVSCTYSIQPSFGALSLKAQVGNIASVTRVATTRSCQGSNVVAYNGVYATGPDGTAHPFPQQILSNNQDAALCNSTAQVRSLDRSGYYLDMAAGILYAKDGTQYPISYVVNVPAAIDTNGNQIRVDSQGNYIDTLGRTLSSAVPNSDGARRAPTVTNVTVPVHTNLCSLQLNYSGTCTEFVNSLSLPHIITLPSGLTYTINYVPNSHAEISSIVLPGGGTISYTYNGLTANGPVIATRTASYSGASYKWSFSKTLIGALPAILVTDPRLNDTTHAIDTTDCPQNPAYTFACPFNLEKYYSGSYSSGTLLKTVNTQYAEDVTGYRPIRVTTTLVDTGQVSETQTDWEATYANQTQIREYGYGSGAPGSLLRVTSYCYLHDQDSRYLAKNIIDRPTTIVVYDGAGISGIGSIGAPAPACSTPSGTVVSKQTISYDGTSLTSLTGAVNHDDQNYSTSNTVRGNATTIASWLNTSGTTLTTSTRSYNTLGSLVKELDGNLAETDIDYTDAFDNAQCIPTGSQTYAFPTLITNPLHQKTSTRYYGCTSLISSLKDENDLNSRGPGTSYTYDNANNLYQVTYPDGATRTSDWNGYAAPLTLTTTQIATPNPAIITTTMLDGIGHIARTVSSAGTVDSSVDGMGLLTSTSMPYVSSATFYTTFSYDALGRQQYQCQPDNGTGSGPCVPGSSYLSWSYLGNVTTQADEGGVSKKLTSDVLGRLTNVVEAGTSANPLSLVTNYSYDALGNLKSVTQQGRTSGDVTRTARSFSYDSMSRLICSSNPENATAACPATATSSYTTGTIGYTYDANGNLITKKDARGITTTYSYDLLNRLIRKTHSDGTLPAAFGYDGNNESGSPLSSSGITSLNAVGRLSLSTNGSNAGTAYSYDSRGRVAQETYNMPGKPGWTTTVFAQHDLAGNVTNFTYPDGRSVQQGFDAAGRTSLIQYSSWNGSTTNLPQTYFSETNGYDAASHLTGATVGSNLPYLSAAYDSRERIQNLTYGPSTAPVWSQQFAWTANNNLQSQTNLITGVQRQFTYDALNRLTTAQDTFSNLAVASGSNGNTGSTTTSGSGAEEAPGQTGAMAEWTNPDDSNLLGDIGESNSGWTQSGAVITLNNVQAPNGAVTATKITASGSALPSVTGAVSSTWDYSDETMTGSVWLRSLDGSTPTVNLYILANGSSVGYKQITLSGTWQLFQVTTGSPIPNNVTALSFMIGGTTSTATGFFMWNPMLEDEGTAGSSVTNILPYSQNFTAANWSHGGLPVTYTPNVGPAPDGTNTATSLAIGGTTGQGGALGYVLNPAPYSQQPITASVYLRVPSGTLSATFALYETGTGATGCNTSVTATLTANWQRVSAACVSQSALSTLRIAITVNAGSTFQMWGAQMELSSTTGPYVATAGAPATMGTSLTNILPYSQQPNGSSWLGTSQFSGVANAVLAPDGSKTGYQATSTAASGWLTNDVSNPALYSNATATASVYLRVPSGSDSSLSLYLIAVGNVAGSQQWQILKQVPVSLTTTWQRFSATAQLPNGLTRLYIQVGNTQSSGQIVDIWGSQLEIAPYAGPYIATTDLPVITGSEPTNILPNSQNLSGTNWSMSLGGCSVNVAVAPDGTGTAANCVSQSTSTDSYLKASVPNPSLYDGETVTASFYLRSNNGGNQTIKLFLQNIGSTGSGAAAQQVITATPAWQRFYLTATLQNGLTYLALQIGGAGTVSQGEGFQVWGAQFAVGSTPAPYDSTNSHTTVYATGQAGTLVTNGLNQAYSYDSFGNILQNGSFESGYTAKNQMTGYLYDAAGNLLSDGMNVMTWDAESRMATAAGATYVYDAEGNRVEKQGSTVTDTVYFGGQPIARYAGGQWTDLIYGPTGLLAEVPGQQNATPVYRVTDNLGSNVGSLLSTGAFVEPVDHTPFGQVFTGSTDDPYLFTGKERDSESGLDYFGARYYSSAMGRFSSPDPSGLTYADIANPQSFNLYSYALNNPLRMIDPSGLTPCDYGPSDQGGNDYEDADNDKECKDSGGKPIDYSETVNVSPDGSGNDTLATVSSNSTSVIQYQQFGPLKLCNSSRVKLGVTGLINLGLAYRKSIVLGGAVAATAGSGVGAPAAGVLAVYGVVTITGQNLAAAGQLFSAATGTPVSPEYARATNLLQGPVLGIGSRMFGASPERADRLASYESLALGGAPLLEPGIADKLADALTAHLDTSMTLLGMADTSSCLKQ